MQQHIQSHLKKTDPCPECGKLVFNLGGHLKEFHSKVSFPCSICNVSSKRKAGLRDHMMLVHNIAIKLEESQLEYKCSKCDLIFDLLKHKQFHEARSHDIKIQCNVCDYQTTCNSV